jgi:isocitrate dehydrogenase
MPLALYWAQALAAQTLDLGLQARFSSLATALAGNEATICAELIAAQSQPRDLGGYYHPDVERVSGVMRPSLLLNRALAALQAKPGRETYN